VTLAATFLMVTLMTALAGALALVSTAETRIAGTYRRGVEAAAAAEAALEAVLDEAAMLPDWTPLLGGVVVSTYTDGTPDRWDDTPAAGNWGANTPVWTRFLSTPLERITNVASDMYVVVWVADDPAECDANPTIDGGACASGTNSGAGAILLVGCAYGPGGIRRTVEATAARTPASALRFTSWREVR
jgi:hypothetical protein